MADTKITGLTANTAPIGTDIMPMVDDPGGSPLTQKVTITNLAAAINALSGRVLISEQTPTGTGTVTWSSIPATYKDLEIEYVARGAQVAASVNMLCYLNNDTTATNYRYQYLQGTGASITGGTGDTALISAITAASSTAGQAGQGRIFIIQYAGTTFNKQITCQSNYRATNDENILNVVNEWESAAAVNRVDLTLSAGNYDTGSTLRLYGVY